MVIEADSHGSILTGIRPILMVLLDHRADSHGSLLMYECIWTDSHGPAKFRMDPILMSHILMIDLLRTDTHGPVDIRLEPILMAQHFV